LDSFIMLTLKSSGSWEKQLKRAFLVVIVVLAFAFLAFSANVVSFPAVAATGTNSFPSIDGSVRRPKFVFSLRSSAVVAQGGELEKEESAQPADSAEFSTQFTPPTSESEGSRASRKLPGMDDYIPSGFDLGSAEVGAALAGGILLLVIFCLICSCLRCICGGGGGYRRGGGGGCGGCLWDLVALVCLWELCCDREPNIVNDVCCGGDYNMA
jgi:hypothetical protein